MSNDTLSLRPLIDILLLNSIYDIAAMSISVPERIIPVVQPLSSTISFM